MLRLQFSIPFQIKVGPSQNHVENHKDLPGFTPDFLVKIYVGKPWILNFNERKCCFNIQKKC